AYYLKRYRILFFIQVFQVLRYSVGILCSCQNELFHHTPHLPDQWPSHHLYDFGKIFMGIVNKFFPPQSGYYKSGKGSIQIHRADDICRGKKQIEKEPDVKFNIKKLALVK